MLTAMRFDPGSVAARRRAPTSLHWLVSDLFEGTGGCAYSTSLKRSVSRKMFFFFEAPFAQARPKNSAMLVRDVTFILQAGILRTL